MNIKARTFRMHTEIVHPTHTHTHITTYILA